MTEFFAYRFGGDQYFLNVAQICAIIAKPDGSAEVQIANGDNAVFSAETWTEFQKRYDLKPRGDGHA